MPVFLRHKYRREGDYHEDLWDSGGRVIKNGVRQGGGYFRVYKRGSDRPVVYRTVGVQGVPAWTYKDQPFRSGYPDAYQFPYTWQYNKPDFSWKADSYGAEAWNRMRPDKPDMSLLNSLYELREWPSLVAPKILKYRNTKSWADYFLAINFGWLPTLNDVRDFVTTTLLMKERLDQLIRDEGKPVTRRISMSDGGPSGSEIVKGYTYDVGAGIVTQCYRGQPTFVDTCKWGSRLWAVGQFQYWLPPGPRDLEWRAKQILRIYGAYPSPAVVWNAIPWSWLVDWFSNVGEIIENFDFTVADRLAANYAFMMRHVYEIYERHTYASFHTPEGGTTDVVLRATHPTETKERTIIDPFGPSVSFDTMTVRQAAILGAIGFSQMPSTIGRY